MRRTFRFADYIRVKIEAYTGIEPAVWQAAKLGIRHKIDFFGIACVYIQRTWNIFTEIFFVNIFIIGRIILIAVFQHIETGVVRILIGLSFHIDTNVGGTPD